jgi:prepilin-type N-terminal cleavage/methylation domain-containing protein
MNERRQKQEKGFTLIETIIAAVAISIIALGGLSYQYFAAVHSRIARAQITATRTGQLLIEDWKNNGGSASYDPSTLGLGFLKSDKKGWGYYITVDKLSMYINLTSSDVAVDVTAGVTIRKLEIKVAWRRDYTEDAPEADDPFIVLTTYARVDASGG